MTVTIVDDMVNESEELFDITLSRTSGLDSRITLNPIDGRIVISDNDGKLYVHNVAIWLITDWSKFSFSLRKHRKKMSVFDHKVRVWIIIILIKQSGLSITSMEQCSLLIS